MSARAVGEEVSGRVKRGPNSKPVGHVGNSEWTSVPDTGHPGTDTQGQF